MGEELEGENQVSRMLFEDLLDFFDVYREEKAFAVAYFDEGHTMLHPKYKPGAPVVMRSLEYTNYVLALL